MKKLVTERELEHVTKGGAFQVTSDMILTPSARDFASRNGISLAYDGDQATAAGGNETAMDRAIREIVTAELGRADATVISAVRSAVGPGQPAESPASQAVRTAAREAGGRNRAVLSAMGENRSGILSRLTTAISGTGCDILDVTQTLVGGYFTMMLIVEIDSLEQDGLTFGEFRTRVLDEVKALGLEGMLMHEDVLRAMHRV